MLGPQRGGPAFVVADPESDLPTAPVALDSSPRRAAVDLSEAPTPIKPQKAKTTPLRAVIPPPPDIPPRLFPMGVTPPPQSKAAAPPAPHAPGPTDTAVEKPSRTTARPPGAGAGGARAEAQAGPADAGVAFAPEHAKATSDDVQVIDRHAMQAESRERGIRDRRGGSPVDRGGATQRGGARGAAPGRAQGRGREGRERRGGRRGGRTEAAAQLWAGRRDQAHRGGAGPRAEPAEREDPGRRARGFAAPAEACVRRAARIVTRWIPYPDRPRPPASGPDPAGRLPRGGHDPALAGVQPPASTPSTAFVPAPGHARRGAERAAADGFDPEPAATAGANDGGSAEPPFGAASAPAGAAPSFGLQASPSPARRAMSRRWRRAPSTSARCARASSPRSWACPATW